MSDLKITCPACSTEIPLTESLAGPLIAREREAARKEAAAQAESLVVQKLAEEKRKTAEAEAVRTAELARLREEAEAKEAKLAEAQKAQADALKRQRELDDRARELDLTLEKRLTEALAAREAALQQKAQEASAEKVRELQEARAVERAEAMQQMETLRAQIETLKKKSEQGSQQLQGEAAEVLLEDRLAAAFPQDALSPVGKGVRGADCLQSVTGPGGIAGRIIWESKRAQNFAGDWPSKLKEDQRREGADIAVLATVVLPKGIEDFGQHEGIWVTLPRFAIPLAMALRQTLVDTSAARASQQGQATKMAMVYDYLTGTRFRQRVEAIVEKFELMRDDLDRERKFYARQWARREAQIGGVIDATIGMYGDLEGIAGRAMPEIEGLDVGLLESPEDQPET